MAGGFHTFKQIVVFLCLLQFCGALQIVLTGSTPVIKGGLTDTLSMRCSLETQNSSSEGVDRKQRSTGGTGAGHEIKHVSSIIVSKEDPLGGEVIVAKIISTGDPDKNSDFENLAVEGTLNPDSIGDPQFLEMTWSQPGQNQSGRYTCEVYTIDSVGRCVAFKADRTVEFLTPDVQELISQMTVMKEVIKEMKSVLQTLKVPHYEEGGVSCGGSGSWPKTISVQFETPYDALPMITLSVLHVDMSSVHNARYVIGKTNVSTTGFTITCSTWADTIIYGLTVAWTSSVA